MNGPAVPTTTGTGVIVCDGTALGTLNVLLQSPFSQVSSKLVIDI
jgi:hypothetical protein